MEDIGVAIDTPDPISHGGFAGASRLDEKAHVHGHDGPSQREIEVSRLLSDDNGVIGFQKSDSPLEPGIRAAVMDIVGPDNVSFDPAVRSRYISGPSDLLSVLPAAVVFPGSTAEVSDLMRGAHACGVPIAHRLAANNPAGAVLVNARGIVLSLERMNRVIEVAVDDGIARVQPHVTAAQLRSAAGHALSDPPEVAAGIHTHQLVSGSQIIGVEAVLPTGEIARTDGGRLARQLAAGDATALLTGPDGALAVITELTIALAPSRAHPYLAEAPPPAPAAADQFSSEMWFGT